MLFLASINSFNLIIRDKDGQRQKHTSKNFGRKVLSFVNCKVLDSLIFGCWRVHGADGSGTNMPQFGTKHAVCRGSSKVQNSRFPYLWIEGMLSEIGFKLAECCRMSEE